MRGSSLFLAASILLSSIAGSYILGQSLLAFKGMSRFVTVKGLSERQVKADKAVWNVSIGVVGNNPSEIKTILDRDLDTARSFLLKYKIAENEITKGNIKVSDKLAQTYGNQTSADTAARYAIQLSLIVTTDKVDAVVEAYQHIDELLGAGVSLATRDYGYSGPRYLFTRLNEVKPEMIAESTRNARSAAEEFAKNSQSTVGKIKNANQGIIAILPLGGSEGASESEFVDKTLRVVSSVDYYIKD
jgi:hypothetical protein